MVVAATVVDAFEGLIGHISERAVHRVSEDGAAGTRGSGGRRASDDSEGPDGHSDGNSLRHADDNGKPIQSELLFSVFGTSVLVGCSARQ